MVKIGLTGGMGSGKSTVASMLKALGARSLDSDQIVRELLKPKTELWKKLIRVFGSDILLKSKEINRKKLAALVFDQPAKRLKLEAILHPAVIRKIKSWLKKSHDSMALVEVPLLYEAHLEKLFDCVIAVVAPKKLQIERCLKKGIPTEAEINKRLKAQWSQTEKAKRADFVIRNEGTKKELEKKVNLLWGKLLAGTKKDVRKNSKL